MKGFACGLHLLALLTIGVAGCGGADSTGADDTGAGNAVIAMVSANEVGDLGTVLADSEGRTLYVFHKDRHTRYLGISSACYGACAESRQPLLTDGEPEAESGAFPTKLGTLKRQDGTLQVTYFGHPLYTYVGDKAPGEADGNGVTEFGGQWRALQPDDEELRTGSTAENSGDRPKKGAWGVAFGAEGAELGIIIYDLAGHTLYTFSKDKGETSHCYGACAKTWPPALTEGKPKAGGEALPGKVGSTKRKDGTVQLTYAGHPLYRYLPDRSPETNGHGRESFGGRWFAIRPNGERP